MLYPHLHLHLHYKYFIHHLYQPRFRKLATSLRNLKGFRDLSTYYLYTFTLYHENPRANY
jgi:hypothetical protein